MTDFKREYGVDVYPSGAGAASKPGITAHSVEAALGAANRVKPLEKVDYVYGAAENFDGVLYHCGAKGKDSFIKGREDLDVNVVTASRLQGNGR